MTYETEKAALERGGSDFWSDHEITGNPYSANQKEYYLWESGFEQTKKSAGLFDLMPEKDDRAKKDGWATGWYINIKCNECQKPFMGDKRAVTCAPCAYNDKAI